MKKDEDYFSTEIKDGLIKKFHIETSPGFTEMVMQKAKAKDKERKMFLKIFIIVLFSFISLAIIYLVGDLNGMKNLSFNPNPIFGNIQKMIFMLKPGFILIIIFSVATTIFLDLLIKMFIYNRDSHN